MHNLIDLSSFLDDFGFFELMAVHVDVRAVVIHGDIVDPPAQVYLGAALSQCQVMHVINLMN